MHHQAGIFTLDCVVDENLCQDILILKQGARELGVTSRHKAILDCRRDFSSVLDRSVLYMRGRSDFARQYNQARGRRPLSIRQHDNKPDLMAVD